MFLPEFIPFIIRIQIQFIIGREVFAVNARLSNFQELNSSWEIWVSWTLLLHSRSPAGLEGVSSCSFGHRHTLLLCLPLGMSSLCTFSTTCGWRPLLCSQTTRCLHSVSETVRELYVGRARYAGTLNGTFWATWQLGLPMDGLKVSSFLGSDGERLKRTLEPTWHAAPGGTSMKLCPGVFSREASCEPELSGQGPITPE